MSSDKRKEEMEKVKHPLENSWSFWFFSNTNKKNWLENLIELADFETAEDYWRLQQYMRLPSELQQGQDYCVFKRGSRPAWEDAANRAGGRWLLNLDRRGEQHMDDYWLDIVLLMIGENFKFNEAISGAVVNIRPRSRISLWTRTTDEKINMAIGKTIKKELKINFKLQYMVHENSKVLYTC